MKETNTICTEGAPLDEFIRMDTRTNGHANSLTHFLANMTTANKSKQRKLLFFKSDCKKMGAKLSKIKMTIYFPKQKLAKRTKQIKDDRSIETNVRGKLSYQNSR